ncbi:MAG: TetR/AcrR family transcriptional regulator [Deltaproteobacteria bacterium]|nr:TetR/AcrR family transcriptional regulator [Deltaproteobacteria bacterium]
MISELRRAKNNEKKNLTREKLLNAAKNIFAEKGYHNTIVSEIVKRAGVGQGTFYRNFIDKRDIFENLLNELMEKLLLSFSDMSSDLPKNSSEYRDASVRAIRKMIETVIANRELVSIFIKEAVTVDRELERKIFELQMKFAQVAKYYLDHAIKNGFARKCDSDIVSKSIVGLGFSFLHMWLGGFIDEKDIDRIINEVVDFAFLGLTGDCNTLKKE